MLHSLYVLLRAAALVAAVAVAGWWTLFLRGRLQDHERALAEREQRIQELHGEVEKRDRRIEELEIALRLLKVDHRVARIEVLEQGPSAEHPGEVETRLRFTELSPGGVPLGPGQELTLRGARVYVEALVIKFGDAYVEHGDFLRGTSLCLFQRLFGEHQQPSDGLPLDAAGARPLPYSAEEPLSEFQQQLWRDFWELANDPARAESLGVRAIHGEAPFMELRPDRSYRVELRASGGLSISAER